MSDTRSQTKPQTKPQTNIDTRPEQSPPPPGASDPRARRSALRKKLSAAVIVAGIITSVVVTRAIWEGTSALADGDAAMSRDEHGEAIRLWRRAARWYLPLAPHVSGAYQRLRDLAGQAEARGDLATALDAWQGVRSSIMATRSFYTPHEELLEPANRHIAAFMAAREGTLGSAAASQPESERTAWHYQLLARDHSPSAGWAIVAIFGFALWLGGAVLFAVRGVTADDTLVPRTAAYAGIMVAAGLFIWALGLYLA